MDFLSIHELGGFALIVEGGYRDRWGCSGGAGSRVGVYEGPFGLGGCLRAVLGSQGCPINARL